MFCWQQGDGCVGQNSKEDGGRRGYGQAPEDKE